MLLREVAIRDCDHAGNTAGARHDGDALRLVELVPERMGGTAGPANSQVPITRDLADHVRRDIESAGDHAPRRSAADSLDQVSTPVE
jgi:hypothetical protein